MKLYKADGDLDGAFILYAETDENVYCEIHHPSGDVGSVHLLGDAWPIERVTGQLGAEQVTDAEIAGPAPLFAVKAEILGTLESHGPLSFDELACQLATTSDGDKNTAYGSVKHLLWDGVVDYDNAMEEITLADNYK